MAYVKQHWKDEVTEYEHRFTETANGDGTITHTKVTGEVLQEGTLQKMVLVMRMIPLLQSKPQHLSLTPGSNRLRRSGKSRSGL